MTGLFFDILDLLNSQAGSMVYHLVISFSLLGALAISIPHYIKNKTSGNRRVIIGIVLLLIFRFATFLVIGIIEQTIFSFVNYIPEISRSFDVLSIIVLLWIWVYSFPSSPKKPYTMFSWLSLLFFGILLIFLWISYSPPVSLGTNIYLAYCNLTIILLLYTGLILVIYKRPKNWVLGLLMFLFLLTGELGQAFILSTKEEYPIFARLMQLSTFPLLFGISYEKELTREIEDNLDLLFLSSARTQLERISDINTNRGDMIGTFLELSKPISKTSPEKSLVKLISHVCITDIVLLITPPNKNKKSSLISGYDLISETYLELIGSNEFQIPGLKKSFLSNSPIHLSENNSTIATLSKIIKIDLFGNSALIPINKEPFSPLFCVLLAYPYTNQMLNKSNIESIQRLQKEIANYYSDGILKNNSENELLENKIIETEERAFRFENEKNLLLDEISTYQNLNIEKINNNLEKSKKTILKLKNQNRELSDNIEKILLDEKQRTEKSRKQFISEEKSAPSLTSFISEARNYSSELTNGRGKEFNNYELSGLINSLYYISAISSNDLELNPILFDLSEIVDKSINFFSKDLRMKNITLRVDYQTELPKINTDKDALYEIINNFLKNAGGACLSGGEIFIKASELIERNSICIDIRDSGEGIAGKDIPLIFSNSQGVDAPPIIGLGNIGNSFTISKLLLEKLGGEIIVSSKIGKGTTFGLIIPKFFIQESGSRIK